MKDLPSTDPEKWERWVGDDSAGTEGWWWFEKANNMDFWYNFFDNYQWHVVIISLSVYYFGILALRAVMKNRGPCTQLKPLIVAYNLAVSLFSVQCLKIVNSIMFDGFWEPGWLHQRLCIRSSKMTNRVLFWSVLIAWSKMVHILDSFFLILLKKDVPFFQVYHHTFMILMSGILIGLGEPVLIIWSTVNMVQHIITYLYFAAKVLEIRLPRFVPKMILIVELVQLIICLAACIYTEHVIRKGDYCLRHPKSIRLLRFVAGSILILVAYEMYHYFRKTSKHRPKKD